MFEKAGTYTFLVREVLPDEATEENGYTVRGTAYDADGRIVTVQVEDNLDGTMTATVDTAGVMLEDGVTASSLVFRQRLHGGQDGRHGGRLPACEGVRGACVDPTGTSLPSS